MDNLESARVIWLRRWTAVAIAALGLRLVMLQLWQGQTYRALAEKNRLRTIPQSAPRGLIVDRTGRRLAASRSFFQIAAIPQDLPPIRPRPPTHGRSAGSVLPVGLIDFQGVFERLGQLVGEPPIYLERRFDHAQYLPFLPAAVATPVSKDVALRVEEARLRLPGVVVERLLTRQYPLGAVASNLLGYVGLPSAEEFSRLKAYGVRSQDMVGRAGIERALDEALRGQSGGSLIEVNHRGKQVRVVGHREPVAGRAVVLTLDADLQILLEREFGDQAGAAVVVVPQTGEVLAMVSMPHVDPGIFAAQDASAIQQALQDPRAPLVNRPTGGLYLPGSIIKPITAITALEQGVIDPSTPITCPGYLTIGDRRFHCWNRDGHGPMTMRTALKQSCNVYFLELGRRLGLERLRDGLLRAGYGRFTGWFLDEQRGVLPAGRRVMEGEIAMLGIGQGQILITPLQAALVVSAIANGGWAIEPWVVARVGQQPFTHPAKRKIGWSPSNLAVVKDGMVAVVNDPDGTGTVARSDRIQIAGKTGTAQTHVPGKTHGWFIGFCPVENPVVAMAIVAEYGGSGGELPAYLGKLVCEYVAEHRPERVVSTTSAAPQ